MAIIHPRSLPSTSATATNCRFPARQSDTSRRYLHGVHRRNRGREHRAQCLPRLKHEVGHVPNREINRLRQEQRQPPSVIPSFDVRFGGARGRLLGEILLQQPGQHRRRRMRHRVRLAGMPAERALPFLVPLRARCVNEADRSPGGARERTWHGRGSRGIAYAHRSG